VKITKVRKTTELFCDYCGEPIMGPKKTAILKRLNQMMRMKAGFYKYIYQNTIKFPDTKFNPKIFCSQECKEKWINENWVD